MQKILFFSFLTLFFTSCFEITEKINVEADGSGKMTVKLDMSESKETLKEYMDSGKVSGMSIPDQKQLTTYLTKVEKTLESVDGMSNATSRGDFNEFIFTFTADFTNVKAMNKAVNKLTKELSRGMLTLDNKYEYTNGQFTRSFGTILSPADYEKLPVMQKFVLESAKMVSIYSFSKAVKKISNQNAELSPSKKVVRVTNTLSDIAKGTKSVENTITF